MRRNHHLNMIPRKQNLCSILYILLALLTVGRGNENPSTHCCLPKILKDEIQSYKPVVNRIINTVVSGSHRGKVWSELADFVDRFGSRISGSENLENAIDYMLNRSESFGLENVHGEPVLVPHWVRGNERATLLSPRVQKLNILGLGGSVGTPPGGITAQALVVESFDELKQKADQAEGKIIVFAVKWESYWQTVKYREHAAVEGAKVGAVATLVRSATDFSINSPHTGWQDYSDDVPKIPTAALTVEDAFMLLRMQKRGENITIDLVMEAETQHPVQSRNSVMEIRGSSKAEKSVVVSGHLDSWDVGSGAMDDGGGAFISWYSLVLLKHLNLRARRTIRAVLWTGEEEGLIGAKQYMKDHNSSEFNLLMESDEGTFNPRGILVAGNHKVRCILEEVLSLLDKINATQVKTSDYVGSDIAIWKDMGVPLASLINDNKNYFWFHHSDGDRMEVEDPAALDRCLALWASVAYVIADLSVDLPRS